VSTTWLEVRPQRIPSELRQLGYVLWRAEPRGEEKPAKVPYRISDPSRRASSTDATTWGTFEDAVEAYAALVDLPADPRRGPIAGFGPVLTRKAGISCIDLDHVVRSDAHQLDVRATTIVERCDSWTELSPSGTGLHVFVLGSVPRGLRGPQIEVYSDARFIALTGHQWPGTPNDLRNQQAYLDHLLRIVEQDREPRRAYTGRSVPPPDDLVGALLAKLQGWHIPAVKLKPWSDGYLVELPRCPWSDEHSTCPGGAAVMIHASGAFDFTCLHAHCAGRDWRDFRTVMDSPQ
jgi:hypothetical protein